MMKRLSILFAAIGAMLFSAACETTNSAATTERELQAKLAGPVQAAVSIHTILPRSVDPDKELVIHSFYGEGVVIVEKLPWLTSLEIQDIIPLERPLKIRGIYDLRLQLSDKGRKQWDAMVRNDSPESEGYAVLVDGVFYMAFHPRKFYNDRDRHIMLDGPFPQEIVKRLNENAPLNYLKLKKAEKAQATKAPAAK